MYYKIKDRIIFRQYDGYGYITDNSDYGYRFLNDTSRCPGENYVSESGAVMLSLLKRTPRFIDDIIDELMHIFIEVEYDVLKQDTVELFQYFVEEGYLSCGETYDECLMYEQKEKIEKSVPRQEQPLVKTDDCSKELLNPNDFLRSIHIEITSACNERCVHCYIPHEDKNSLIDPELFYRILEEGRDLNIINVTMSGGEPLIHKDFLGFLRKSRELDLSVNILSNLTLLTKEHVAEMQKNPLLSVQTSLYSMDPSVHDSITGLKGSYDKTVEGIKKLLAARIPLQISCPVMKQNKDSFVEVIRWGKEHSIGVVSEPVIFAVYDGSQSNLSNRLSLNEIEDVLDLQIQEGFGESIREIAGEKEALTENHPICAVCRYNFCVSAEGNVFPCAGWQSKIIASLKDQSVKEIWETSKQIKELREIKRSQFPQCVDCKDRGYCTVCMMSNSNENPDKDAFHINDYHCKVSAMLHDKVDTYFLKQKW